MFTESKQTRQAKCLPAVNIIDIVQIEEVFGRFSSGMGMRESVAGFDRLKALHLRYGSLNVAYVAAYIEAHGVAFVSAMAQDMGVSRSVVRRALQVLHEKDRARR
jgi:hypothetical protein